MPDLTFIHHPDRPLTPRQERALLRHARRLGYSGVVALPDNQRGDLLRTPGLVVAPGVAFALSHRSPTKESSQ